MIIDDFHVVRMPLAPHKTDTPLLIDSDRILTLRASLQGFQLIARRRRKNSKLRCGMQLQQLPQRHALERSEAFAVLVVKKFFGVLRAEALNHT
jgi:hypothetical protein